MGRKTIRVLFWVFSLLSIGFGCLSLFAFFSAWAKPILSIALANMTLTAAMAAMNSVLLDRMEGKK